MKIKDRLLLGVISGVLGSVPGRLLNTFEYHTGLTEAMYGQMAATAFISQKYIDKPQGKLLGSIINQIIAIGTGITTTYALSLTGRDYAILKGSMVGTTYWLLINGLAPNITGTLKPRKPISPLLSLIDHIIFGVSSALISLSLGDDSLFRKDNFNKNKQNTINYNTPEYTTLAEFHT